MDLKLGESKSRSPGSPEVAASSHSAGFAADGDVAGDSTSPPEAVPVRRPIRVTRPVAAVGLLGILIALAMSRLHVVMLPHRGIFWLIVAWAGLANVYWWAWGDERLAGLRDGRLARCRRGFRMMWSVYFIAMLSPVMLRAVGFDAWHRMPVPFVMWIMVWHLFLAPIGTLAVVFLLCRRVLERSARGAPDAGTEDRPVNPARRALLARTVIAAPVIIAGGSVAAGMAQAGRFRVRKLTAAFPNLPDRLRGLTITHLSDIHLGRLFRPNHLPAMIDAVNRLDSDLVAITGDVVDLSNDFLPEAMGAIGQLEHRYGRFLVAGNHDVIDDGRAWVRYVNAREPGHLEDRCVPIEIGGETIQVAGLFWSRMDDPAGDDPGHIRRTERALKDASADRFTIALAHHPHAFDALAARHVDLTLAGHTHGGQLMLTPPGAAMPIGAGSLMFRYIWGWYTDGPSRMYVNSGVGNWFPIRVNAPAEIVQIRLV